MALFLVVVLTLTLLPGTAALAKDRGDDGPMRAGGDADNVGGFKFHYEIDTAGGERDTYWGEGVETGRPDSVVSLKNWLLFVNDTFAIMSLLRR